MKSFKNEEREVSKARTLPLLYLRDLFQKSLNSQSKMESKGTSSALQNALPELSYDPLKQFESEEDGQEDVAGNGDYEDLSEPSSPL